MGTDYFISDQSERYLHLYSLSLMLVNPEQPKQQSEQLKLQSELPKRHIRSRDMVVCGVVKIVSFLSKSIQARSTTVFLLYLYRKRTSNKPP